MSFRRDYDIKAGETLFVNGECEHGPKTVSLPCDHEVFANGPEKPAFPDMPGRTGCCGAALNAGGSSSGEDVVSVQEQAAIDAAASNAAASAVVNAVNEADGLK